MNGVGRLLGRLMVVTTFCLGLVVVLMVVDDPAVRPPLAISLSSSSSSAPPSSSEMSPPNTSSPTPKLAGVIPPATTPSPDTDPDSSLSVESEPAPRVDAGSDSDAVPVLGSSRHPTARQRAERIEQLGTRTMTIAATGDVLLHTQLWRQAESNGQRLGTGAYDYRPMLNPLRPLVGRADLAICHMEVPIAPAGESFTTYPLFGVQPEIATAIAAAGYDRCSTASNHTLDRGVAGINRTIDVLRANGVDSSGSAKVPEGIGPRVFFVNGISVVHLAYTYSYNGLRMPKGEEWRSALIDPGRIISDARLARKLGAEVVIVSMHWGTERSHAPDEFQRRVADQITAPGVIDLVIGHHAHVLQPIEKINETWVMFGSGNVLSSMPTNSTWPAATQDGAVFEAKITVTPDDAVEVAQPKVYPTWVDRDHGYRIRLVQSAIASGRFSGATLDGLRSSLERTRAVLGPYIAPEPK